MGKDADSVPRILPRRQPFKQGEPKLTYRNDEKYEKQEGPYEPLFRHREMGAGLTRPYLPFPPSPPAKCSFSRDATQTRHPSIHSALRPSDIHIKGPHRSGRSREGENVTEFSI